MCHVGTAMWQLFIHPHVGPKSPKMSDTLQPLMLAHHHANIIMTHVALYTFHVLCTDDDVIHTDVNSSLLTGLG